MGIFLGRHRWWVAAAIAGIAVALCMGRSGNAPAALAQSQAQAPAVATPLADNTSIRITDPDTLRQAAEAAERERLAKMKPGELAELLKRELQTACQAANPSLNYIKADRRGQGIYCVHDFYGRYSLSSGPLAHVMTEYASRRSDELRRLKITRVGAWGTGEYASGSWLDLR